MKASNLLKVSIFSFVMFASAMGAAMPVEQPADYSTSIGLAREVVKFWCSPLGTEVFNIFKSEKNQDFVMPYLKVVSPAGWRHVINMNSERRYSFLLATRVLVINGANVFGNIRLIEDLSKSLKTGFEGEFMRTGIVSEIFNRVVKSESELREYRLSLAEDLVKRTLNALAAANPNDWLNKKVTKSALAQMLLWMQYTALDQRVTRDLEIALGVAEATQIKKQAASGR